MQAKGHPQRLGQKIPERRRVKEHYHMLDARDVSLLRTGKLKNVFQTGTLMVRLSLRYCKDVAPFMHMSLPEFFEHVKMIPYNRDPAGTEFLQRPYFTLKAESPGGDCLARDTKVLTQNGPMSIQGVKVGDVIAGRLGWTSVLKVWDKGLLPAKKYTLDNGGFFEATADHLMLLEGGKEKRLGDFDSGEKLLRPKGAIVKPGFCELSDDDLRFIGLYIADGWMEPQDNRLAISGKDGHPKEAQKKWVQEYADARAWSTYWHPRYIRMQMRNDNPVFDACRNAGGHAYEKKIPASLFNSLSSAQGAALLDGLYADAHQPDDRKSGFCYSTTSPILAFQVRILLRMQGFSCKVTKVDDHGGLGTHPIYRVYPRFFKDKDVQIVSVESEQKRFCYDIQTEDGGIYLPEADIIVHNCDDRAICIGSFAYNLGMPFRFVAMARQNGNPLHHVATDVLMEGAWKHVDPTYNTQVMGKHLFRPARAVIIGAWNGVTSQAAA
jgi:hypothetical protein